MNLYFLVTLLTAVCLAIGTSLALPNSGVVIGRTRDALKTTVAGVETHTILFKITEKINEPFFCSEYEFKRSYEDSIRRIIKNPHFKIVLNELSSSGRFIWQAARYEYLSFISDGSRFGTWLVGDVPERDNGWGFLKPQQSTLLPVDRQDNEKWHWNVDGHWTASNRTTKKSGYDSDGPVCVGVSLGAHVYAAERVIAREGMYTTSSTFILPPLSEADSKALADSELTDSGLTEGLRRLLPVSTTDHVFWDVHSERWVPVVFGEDHHDSGVDGTSEQCTSDLELTAPSSTMVPLGEPIWVYMPDTVLPGRMSPLHPPAFYRYTGTVVNSELLEDSGSLRLFVRLFAADLGGLRDSAVYADGAQEPLTLMYGALNLFSPPLETPIGDLGANENPFDITVEIGRDGVRGDMRILPVSSRGGESGATSADGVGRYYQSLLLPATHVLRFPGEASVPEPFAPRDTVERGDHVWFWVDSGRRTFDVFTECVSKVTAATDSGSTRTTLVFSYAANDRRDVMHRTMASVDSDFLMITLVYRLAPKANTTESVSVLATLGGEHVSVRSLFNLHGTAHTLAYLRQYLGSHEHKFSDQVSSCYLYHAAIPFPQQLIYAAEVLCLLVGAKPVVMVQYDTPSDHQWKFPLVRDLVRMIHVAVLAGARLGVHVGVHEYHDDRTLVFSRSRRTYLKNMLLPRGEAQALHIVPYPNHVTEGTKEARRQQVYNSWWNGIVLGYPESFVRSYCNGMHVDLTDAEKRTVMNLAKNELAYKVKMDLDRPNLPPIQIGYDHEVPAEVWGYLGV